MTKAITPVSGRIHKAVAQLGGADALARGPYAELVEAECLGDRGIQVGGILERDEIDEPDTVGEGRLRSFRAAAIARRA